MFSNKGFLNLMYNTDSYQEIRDKRSLSKDPCERSLSKDPCQEILVKRSLSKDPCQEILCFVCFAPSNVERSP